MLINNVNKNSKKLRKMKKSHERPILGARRTMLLDASAARCTILMLVLWAAAAAVGANTPPRFVVEGGSEIVVTLREGEFSPVG